MQRIVLLVAESQQAAPEFLELLRALVKVEGLDLTIKRNQALVMKYIMQNFKKAAYVLDQPRNLRWGDTNERERWRGGDVCCNVQNVLCMGRNPFTLALMAKSG